MSGSIPRHVAALALAGALAMAGCSTGTDAVVAGGDTEFVAPDGKSDIAYERADRRPLAGTVSGESLLEPGTQVGLADFGGKVVVLNIWGSWCGPCRTEAPELQRMYDQTRDSGVALLGIDVRDDIRDAAEDFMRDRGLTYPSIYDPPSRTLLALRGYPRSGVPTTVVLDRQHRVAQIFLQPVLAADLLPIVQRLAAET